MERRKLALTPEIYTRAITTLSKRYSNTSVFPGNNYADIGEWMRLKSAKAEDGHGDGIPFASKSGQPHDLVVVYNSGERKWDMQQYSQGQYRDFTASAKAPEGGLGQIVFLRGFLSPPWVAAIGSKYNIDPEFFRRHMDFLSSSIGRHAYSSPSLASSSKNLFRLCVSTLLHRDDFGGQDVPAQRSSQSAELATYKIQQLGSTRVSCGDSIVREYSTLCSSFSVVEQWISFCVCRTDKGWTVLAWLDQGRPLEQSPPGPWTRHIQSRATALPVLQHHHKMAFRTTHTDPETNGSAEVQQSTALLPLQYDSLVALVDLARRAPQDPLHMCIPLFAHAAFSEVQFLNLMESRIQIQVNTVAEGVSADSLSYFQYFYDILNRHAQQIKDSARALNSLVERSAQVSAAGKAESPTVTGVRPPGLVAGSQRHSSDQETARCARSSSSDGTFTARGLTEDYEQLHARCVDLSAMCTRGITLAMNKAAIEESRKAIEQSERVKKLTLLATFFIPLSFSSSLFGMNIDLLGQETVSFWWFFVLCVPITLLAYVIYLWDWPGLKRWWARLSRRSRSPADAQRNVPNGRGEKDPGHIV